MKRSKNIYAYYSFLPRIFSVFFVVVSQSLLLSSESKMAALPRARTGWEESETQNKDNVHVRIRMYFNCTCTNFYFKKSVAWQVYYKKNFPMSGKNL